MKSVEECVDEILCGKPKPVKKHHRNLFLFIGSFLISFAVVFLSFYPIFDDKSLTNLLQKSLESKHDNATNVGDEQWNENGSVYEYWEAPSNSFGTGNLTMLNVSWFQGFFNHYTHIGLNASPNNETWYDANQGLIQELNWSNDTNSYKISWIINTSEAPTDLYYRLTFAIDKHCVNFINKTDNHSVTFEIPNLGSDNATLNITFNWSDIIPLIQNNHIFVKRGLKTINNQTYMWFRLQTNNKIQPDREFVIDPIFGNNQYGEPYNLDIGNRFGATKGIPSSSGTLDYITCYMAGVNTGDVAKFMIYSQNGNTYTQVYESWELRESNGTLNSGWCNHTVTKTVNIESGIKYFLGAISSSANQCQIAIYTTLAEDADSGGYRRKDMTYGSELASFNEPWSANSSTSSVCAYAGYTEGGAGETWQNLPAGAGGTGINGTYSNTTIWKDIEADINGTYSNETLVWYDVDKIINGTYSNTTVWYDVDKIINGTYSNLTVFQNISNTINGTYSNLTVFKNISNTINGTYSNTSIVAWKNIITTINGTYSNTTIWKDIEADINGTYSNETITWQDILTIINGTYSNTSIPANITISNIYPANNSNITDLQPTLYFTLTSTYGTVMNYSVYNGTTLLFNGSNAGNGTYYGLYWNATNYTRYNWSIHVESAGQWLNQSLEFYVYLPGHILSTPGYNIFILLISIGIVIFLLRRKRN